MSAETQKVDVLAVMDDAIAREYNPFERDNQSRLHAELMEARAAVAELIKLREAICDIFMIGSAVRTNSTILANISNSRRRSICLSAVEHEFFTSELSDEDFEGETIEDCCLGWGADPAEYVEQFRTALARIGGAP